MGVSQRTVTGIRNARTFSAEKGCIRLVIEEAGGQRQTDATQVEIYPSVSQPGRRRSSEQGTVETKPGAWTDLVCPRRLQWLKKKGACESAVAARKRYVGEEESSGGDRVFMGVWPWFERRERQKKAVRRGRRARSTLRGKRGRLK